MAARQIGSISKGSGGSKRDTTASGVSCVRYGELYSKFDRMIRRPWGFVSAEVARGYTPIRYGDVLFAASGEKLDEIGKSAVNLMTEPAVCGGDVIILRPAQSLAHAFAGYAFENPIACAQKSSFGRGTTIKHLYPTELRTLMVAFPPLPEQAAIVRFLDWATQRVDRAIRAKRRLVALVTEQKQAIIHRAVTQGLDPSVPMKASGIPWLGEIPAHWEARKLRHAIALQSGFAFPSTGFVHDETAVRLLRGINVTPAGMRWTDTVRWRRTPGDGLEQFQLEAGDIVLGMDRPIVAEGVRVALITLSDAPALLLQRVARIRPSGPLNAPYLLLLLTGRLFANYITPIFTGVSVPHLSPEQIRAFAVPFPPPDEQAAIVAHLDDATRDLDATIERTQRQIGLLREYRARLVADVVTGKLDVRAFAETLPDEAPDDIEAIEADVDEDADDDETGDGADEG